MSTDRKRCQAVTKAGNPCQNYARAGSDYCWVHQNVATHELPAAADDLSKPAKAPKWQMTAAERAEFRRLVLELNDLAEELKAADARYTPPPFSMHGLLNLVQENIHRFTPAAQREIIDTLRASFRGTKPEDLVNPETWKGFWYVLNYLAQNQKSELVERLNRKLEKIPGFALLSDLRAGLKDARPSDFLDPDTWKGLYYILNYSAKMQIEQVKQRIRGPADEG